ncbi:MAG TPA: PfkB family carbohydrate kinase [Chitinophagales bacterium]|nr:PfkB family carbohydrate kinase [Chitinophagales bacterium]
MKCKVLSISLSYGYLYQIGPILIGYDKWLLYLHDMDALVIGDLILDIYNIGIISRISPEAPVPVVLNPEKTYAAGGAANVAVNLASMGLEIGIAGIVGMDHNSLQMKNILSEYYIQSVVIASETSPTITKIRVIGNGKHLVRLDNEMKYTHEADVLLNNVLKLEVPSWVVLSDYDKGSLADTKRYIAHFQSKGAKVIVDPKKEMSAYEGAWFIKPNKNEFLKYVGVFDSHEELVLKAQEAIQTYHFEHMLVTLGGEGMMYVTADEFEFFPAINQEVADITGAGDTVLAGLVYALAKGSSIKDAILFSKRMAELSVTKVGTYVLQKEDILVKQPS